MTPIEYLEIGLRMVGILTGMYLASFVVARGWKHGMGKPNHKWDIYLKNTNDTTRNKKHKEES